MPSPPQAPKEVNSEEHNVDPTKNVLDLVEGEVKRLDDLRFENNRRIDAEITHVKEIISIRAAYDKDIRAIETERLASIRQVDILHQSSAADRQQSATASLERVVDSTAKTLAAQSSTMMSVIEGRLAALERSSYEGKGKQAVADPQQAALIALVESLRESRSTGAGRSGGLQAGWGWIVGAVGLIGALMGIFAMLAK